jgi:uncharacterized protein (TIGR03083 family)
MTSIDQQIKRETQSKKDVLWPRIHAERAALLADLEKLSDDQWASPSLCAGWSVQQLVGHMVSTTKSSPKGFVTEMVKNKFSFTAMAEKTSRALSTGTPADTLARYRASVDTTTVPPGPLESWLGEALIHGEDIRRPLGIKRTYSTDDLMTVANFYKGSNLLIGAKNRIKGLKLVATDYPWSAGSGPEVTGTLLSLLMAMVGRGDCLKDLSGQGLAEFSARF